MAISQLKIVVSILAEIGKGEIPKATDYEISSDQYADILDAMQDEGFIKGLSVLRGGQGNKVLSMNLSRIKITIKGMEYLQQNSNLMKTYRGLKELREWLPF